MMTMKQFAAVLAAFSVILCCSVDGAPVTRPVVAAATGEVAPELDVAMWVKGKETKLAALKDKKYVVLFFWTISKQGTQNFADMAKLAKEYEKKVAFVGVGIDAVDSVRELPELKDLPFPVAADDKLTSVNLYMRERDRVPMAALIGKDGILLWRGLPEQLEAVLKEVLEGKFDLKGAIQRETFSNSVTDAMKIRDYSTVLKLLNSELVLYPENMELINLKVRVLGTLLGKPEDALAFLDEVVTRSPKNLALYELTFSVLKDGNRNKEKNAWFDRLLENFGDQPVVLLKFAQNEMQYPVEQLRLDNVFKLCHAAYNAPKFKDNTEKGLIADEYARILYYCGRPDKALEIAKEAMVLLQGTPGFDRAKASVVYYNSVLTISKQIK